MTDGADTSVANRDGHSQLLDALVEDVLAHGLASSSLRAIGGRVGVSARMLVHHFGSRRGLVDAVLDAIRAREIAVMDELLDAMDVDAAPSVLVAVAWDRLVRPESLGRVRLGVELEASAARGDPDDLAWLARRRDQWTAFLTSVVAPRLPGDATPGTEISPGTPSGLPADAEVGAVATLVHTTMLGLLREHAAGADPAAVGRAVALLGSSLDALLARADRPARSSSPAQSSPDQSSSPTST